MSNHQKRLAVPKSWPVARKEETYTTKAGAGPHGEEGVPLLIVLRDVLGYVDSKKEARYALGQDSVLVNGVPVSDERVPIGMFDILAFLEREEYYRVFPDEGGRLSLTPIDAEAADSKLGKIDRKTQVPGGDTQLTLHDGRTLLVDDDATYATNDSIVVANEGSEERRSSDDSSGQRPREDEIVAHFTYEEGALVTAVRGAHAGRVGTVDEIQVTPGSSDNNVLIDADEGEDFETVEEFVVVIDENFTSDSDADAEVEAGVEEDPADDEVSDVADESDAEATDAEADETEPDADVDEVDAEEADVEQDAVEAEAEPDDAETESDTDVDEVDAEEADVEQDAVEAEAEPDDAEESEDEPDDEPDAESGTDADEVDAEEADVEQDAVEAEAEPDDADEDDDGGDEQ